MGRLADDLNGFALETSADSNEDKRRGKRVNKKAVICWNSVNPSVNSDAHEAEMVNFSEAECILKLIFSRNHEGLSALS